MTGEPAVPPRVLVAVMSRVARNRLANALMGKTLPPLDRFVHRLSGGRSTVFSAMMPTLVLETTGRRTGRPRRSPLLYIAAADGSLAVLASNFGRDSHPGWSANLLADPRAKAVVDGREIVVEAELLTGRERDDRFGGFLRMWAAYQDYADRSGRELRIFRLVPAA